MEAKKGGEGDRGYNITNTQGSKKRAFFTVKSAMGSKQGGVSRKKKKKETPVQINREGERE